MTGHSQLLLDCGSELVAVTSRLRYLPGTFAVTRKTKSKRSVVTVFGGRQRTSPNYSQAVFWHNQDGALYELHLCMLVCNQKYENVYLVDIIYLILH